MVVLKINEDDNVAVAIETMTAGESVIKYGYPIGHTQAAVRKGEWIYTHNL